MTDREMLEFAAKAAGLGLPDKDDTDEIDRQYEFYLGLWCKFPWGWEWFRPHMDDGQALRLAVNLRMNVHLDSNMVDVDPDGVHWFSEAYGDDPYAATRRAIVRAAAEIGKDME